MVRHSSRRAIFTLLFLMALPAALASQTVSSTTGAINGKVIDKTSAVLPGVTVTIASPSMMGTRNTVTAEDGMYRFAAIPPGEYKVTFELTGFQTLVREGIRVTLGFTATVNGELGVASLSESVTVTGQSPVVDTSSTAMTTNFDAKQLASNLGGKNIRVNLISAGPYASRAARSIRPGEFEKSIEYAASRSPLPRPIKPEEVANATVFLCSDLASAVTGQILYVDCGYNVMGV